MNTDMTPQEAIAFYHSLLRFGVQPGLSRIQKLCAALGDPQKKLSCVHVAGTNGKGSTCTEIASVLSAAGYKTGLYTSPYVLRFEERIQINGALIPGCALAPITQIVKRAVEELNAQDVYPTEFEAITAAAFLYFAQEKCDVVVLETGLGGRFDATNLIEQPLVCVITSVSKDHMGVLGNTLGEIAFEKSGIIKKDCPVITSALQPSEALRVIRQTALDVDAPLTVVDHRNCFQILEETVSGTTVRYQNDSLAIPFPGLHQLDNAALVIGACIKLREKGYRIEDAAIRQGIASSFIPARTEILCKEPLILLDGSHNDGSTKALAALVADRLAGRRVTAVLGLMADKDVDAVLQNLLPVFDRVITVTPSNPRALSAQRLAEKISAFDKPCDFVDDPHFGIDKALCGLYDNNEVLIVCGSLYLAADVREYLILRIDTLYKGKN